MSLFLRIAIDSFFGYSYILSRFSAFVKVLYDSFVQIRVSFLYLQKANKVVKYSKENSERKNVMKTVYRVDGGCQLCLMCVYQCPAKAIDIIEDVSTVIDEDKCLGCGKCASICQSEVIIKVEKE